VDFEFAKILLTTGVALYTLFEGEKATIYDVNYKYPPRRYIFAAENKSGSVHVAGRKFLTPWACGRVCWGHSVLIHNLNVSNCWTR
jgi:hypothetical protein